MNRAIRIPILLLSVVAWLLTAPRLSAQLLAFNQQSAPKLDVSVQSNKVSLRDALLQFKKQQGIDILFEEKLLEGITVSTGQFKTANNIERSLTPVLKPYGLKLKKVSKDTFVIVSSKLVSS